MEFERCPGCMEEKHQHPICEHCGWDERHENDVQQLPAGTILRGQYLIGRVLGQGGFGITYLGWDLYLDIPVAIKEYYPGSIVTRDTHFTSAVTSYTGTAGEQYEANKLRFMREAKALAKFENLHNIVRIYSFFPENNTVYLVMEYAKGQTLQQRLKAQGTMELAQVLQILEPVMQDLQKVHESGIIHRDISPDNIMLLENGTAKLLDFGAVRQVDNPDQEAQLSKSTEAILKQGFAPMEQYNGRGSLGAWTDVYSLCATICYCLNGKVPTPAPDRTLADDTNDFIQDLPITQKQKEILAHGMAIKPRDRIASVSQLLSELKQSLKQKTPKKPDDREIHHHNSDEKKPKKPFRWKLPAIAALLVVLLGIGGYFMVRTNPTGGDQASRITAPYSQDLVLRHPDRTGDSQYAFGTRIHKEDVASVEFFSDLDQAPPSAQDVSASGNGKVLLWTVPGANELVDVKIAGEGGVYLPENADYLFGNRMNSTTLGSSFQNLQAVDFAGAVSAENTVSMKGMFKDCSSLEALDLSTLDTHKVTSMENLFNGCSKLTSVDLSGWNTEAVTTMAGMFKSCRQLKVLDLTSFSTENLKNMHGMFLSCESLETLDLSSFRIGNVKDTSQVFARCPQSLRLYIEDQDLRALSQKR